MLGDDVGSLLDAHVQVLDEAWHLAQVGFDGGAMWLRDTGLVLGQRVRLRVLARDVSINLQPVTDTSIQNHLPCVVDAITPDAHPSQTLLRLRCGDTVLLSRVTARGVHALLIAGVNTNSCVLATTSAASVRDYAVIVVKGCVESLDGPGL